jgi:hypothetical protein
MGSAAGICQGEPGRSLEVDLAIFFRDSNTMLGIGAGLLVFKHKHSGIEAAYSW